MVSNRLTHHIWVGCIRLKLTFPHGKLYAKLGEIIFFSEGDCEVYKLTY